MKIGIVGLGPRGLSIFERLCANIKEGKNYVKENDYDIYIFDPYPPGGAVWRKNQSKHLLMNTVASQITLYTDESIDCAGPIVKGPSLYEWANSLKQNEYYNGLPRHIQEEIKKMNPNSYPTRAFYGYYMEAAYNNLITDLPSNINVFLHRDEVINIIKVNNELFLETEDSKNNTAVDKAVLTLGHTDHNLNQQGLDIQKFSNDHNLLYYKPANPADINLSDIKPNDTVLIRGLGLNFFDYMALFTIGRDGKFEEKDNKELIYIPSGYEPKMVAGSRRGVPHHSRGENQKGASERHDPIFLTEDMIQILKSKDEVHFGRDLWPLIVNEVESTYYSTYIRNKLGDEIANNFLNDYKQTINNKEDTLLKYRINKKDFLNWDKISHPHSFNKFYSTDEYHQWLDIYLKSDVEESQLGNKAGPLKAALDVLRDIRNEVRLIVDHGGIVASSYENELRKWYTPLNAYLSIGPPVRRIEEMRALIKCGLLTILGPNATFRTNLESGLFEGYSPLVKDSLIKSNILIESRLPEVSITLTSSKLINNLLKKAMATEYKINSKNSTFNTGGLAVSKPPNRLISSDGKPHDNIFIFGVPTEGVHWVTFAGVRPGVNSVTLMESDSISREILFGRIEESVEIHETIITREKAKV
ncbi:FAD/NAD(P)-binding protein (plasmid) [Alkalihalophilus sp. As8PL]|uniref:FAD/NAD(P)-binding protein n=1 Tax=Alkalihalophilus sp. As8PL TaxID=3237103 RepID=A0AB39BNB6_9BACI